MARRTIEPTINAVSTVIVVVTTVLIYFFDRLTRGAPREGDGMTDRVGRDGLTRRDFLRRTAEPGLAASAAGALAACAKREPAAGAAAVGEPARSARWRSRSASTTGPTTSRPTRWRISERETGIAVSYDTYESNEELLAKLQSGARGYDVVVPSSYSHPGDAGVEPPDGPAPRPPPHFVNIERTFVDPPWDRGTRTRSPTTGASRGSPTGGTGCGRSPRARRSGSTAGGAAR